LYFCSSKFFHFKAPWKCIGNMGFKIPSLETHHEIMGFHWAKGFLCGSKAGKTGSDKLILRYIITYLQNHDNDSHHIHSHKVVTKQESLQSITTKMFSSLSPLFKEYILLSWKAVLPTVHNRNSIAGHCAISIKNKGFERSTTNKAANLSLHSKSLNSSKSQTATAGPGEEAASALVPMIAPTFSGVFGRFCIFSCSTSLIRFVSTNRRSPLFCGGAFDSLSFFRCS